MTIAAWLQRASLALVAVLSLGSCTPRAEIATADWTYHPAQLGTENACPGTETACAAWLAFRRAHPWPYQAISLYLAPNSGEAAIVFSEPPPSFDATAHLRALRALFGENLVEARRFRWGVGIDGWLEDVVVRVRLGDPNATASVLSGQTMQMWDIPAELSEPLRHLYRRAYKSAAGFAIDPIDITARAPPRYSIGSIDVFPIDAASWLSDPGMRWRPLDGEVDDEAAFASADLPLGAYESADGALIAFAAPQDSHVDDLAAEFHRFAVASDLLVTAWRTLEGEFVLVARARQEPFAALPPLRFETLKQLAAHRATELAQSYERQRIFAGRIETGEHAGWDWAPIYLSPQLQDTEFGVLLNIADQKLKSWSEAGDVRYYDFLEAQPSHFPFPSAASSIFENNLGSDSLTFNWNTDGFSILTETSIGSLLTADRSGALPVLYLPAGGRLGAGPPSAEAHAFIEQQMQTAGDYFIGEGDPVLTRVVQNVLLYQAVENLYAPPAEDAVSDDSGTRTEAVAGILEPEAQQWLTRAAANNADPATQRAVRTFLARPSMTARRAAEWLAHPQTTTGAYRETLRTAERAEAEIESRRVATEAARAAYERAFARYCDALVSLGGTRLPRADGGEECAGPSAGISPEDASRIRALDQAVVARSRDLEVAELALQRTTALRERAERDIAHLAGEAAAFDDLARAVARAPSLGVDVEALLQRALAAADEIVAHGSIRTPSIVLSRSEHAQWMIGGHNIGGRLSAVRVIGNGGRTSLSDLSSLRARSTGGPPPPPRTPRTPQQALHPRPTGQTSTTGATEATAARGGGRLLDMILERPTSARIDLRATRRLAAETPEAHYVQNLGGDVYAVVSPRGGPARVVVGRDGVFEALAEANARGPIVFDGIGPRAADALGRSLDIRQLGRGEPEAGLFGGGGGRRGLSYSGPTEFGGRSTLSFIADAGSARRIISVRPDWRSATVELPVRRTTAQGATTTVRVLFDTPAAGFGLRSFGMNARTAASRGPRARTLLERFTRQEVDRAAAENASMGPTLLRLKARITRDLRPEELDFFFESNVGDVRATERNRGTRGG